MGVSCAVLMAALASHGQEADPDFDPLGEINDLPKMVRVQVEWIEMAHPTLTKLMREHRKSANDGDLRDACAKLVEGGEATVLETAMVLARPGQKATSESIEEYMYPTEYEPAICPGNSDLVNVDVEASDLATPPTPTAFETRNLGTTLEVEPNLGSNDKVIDLRFAPEIVYHVKNEVWLEWRNKRATMNVTTPTMYSLRLSTAVSMMGGEYLMVAAQSPKGVDKVPDHTRKLMVFVKCDVLTVGR